MEAREAARGSGGGAGATGGAGGAVSQSGALPPVYNGLRGTASTPAGSSTAGTSPVRRPRRSTTLRGAAWICRTTGASSWPSTRAPRPARGGGFLDGGVGWYRKSFTVDQASSGQRILIEFDGVYMNSEVWINGTSLGTRPYGYTSFEYDLTPYVTFGGNNVIAVRVNNNQPNSRFYSGSGIYRNVWLTTVNPVHVPYNGAFVSTPSISSGSATVSVSTQVQNQSASAAAVTVTTTILTPSGAVATSGDSASTSVAAGATSTVEPEPDRQLAAALVAGDAQPLSSEGGGQGRRRHRGHVPRAVRNSHGDVRREQRSLPQRAEHEDPRGQHAPRPRRARLRRQLSGHRTPGADPSEAWA